ncbi:MAG: radical SAM-associated putative lipoprotein [Paludibacter sp.]|nr:radical SAM-associated putative lipoprotein [Paludibacter sp.]
MSGLKKVFIFLVLVLLFACNSENDYAIYDINGTVTDSLTNEPAVGIRIIREPTDYLLFGDTITTDANGNYSFEFTDYYNKKATFKLKILDMDGDLNGGDYQNKEVAIKVNSDDWGKSRDDYYKAWATITKNIELQLK